jgi:hypothetical protein
MRTLLPSLTIILLASTASAFALPKEGNGQPPVHQPPPPPAEWSALLDVPLIAQQNCCWCWAASGQMVMTYTGNPIPQCTQATYQFGQAKGLNCCNSPTPGPCVSGGQVEIGHYGYTYSQLGADSALTGAQISNEISNRHMPWILNPNGPGFGHVIVGVGYTMVAGQIAYVAINDPWPPNQGDFYWESYADYKCGFWSGVCHTEGYDLYAITPPAPKFPRIPVVDEQQLTLQPGLGPESFTNASSAALAALPVFAQLIDADAKKRLGIASGAALTRATLDAPVDEYTVSLAQLRNWSANGRAADLLSKSPGEFIPVEIDGKVAATFRVVSNAGKWHVAAFGGAALGAGWARARANGGQFLVEVEGLELAFSGRRAGDKVFLTPVFDEPNIKITAGREEAAEDIFTRIQPQAAAQKLNVLGKQ